jgi:hypothetical protein
MLIKRFSQLNAGDVWHTRSVTVTSLADEEGKTDLLAGKVMLALSANSGLLPVMFHSIKAWAIAGTAGTYPPTFMQVDFQNNEFVNGAINTSSYNDSIVDAGGQGSGCPAVGLGIPPAIRRTRVDFGTAATTVLATATSLPQGSRVMWRVTLSFKF